MNKHSLPFITQVGHALIAHTKTLPMKRLHTNTPPKPVLQAAQAEPKKIKLDAYYQTILILRAKRFSFRQIANWLNARGLPTDTMKVYRVWLKFRATPD